MAFPIIVELQFQARNAQISGIVTNIRRELENIPPVRIQVNIDDKATVAIAKLNSELSNVTKNLQQIQVEGIAATRAIAGLGSALGGVSNFNTLAVQAVSSTKQITDSTRIATTSVQAMGEQAARAVRNFAGYAIAVGSIVALTGAIREGTTEGIAFERQITKLQQTSGQSRGDLAGLESEIRKVAQAYGSNAVELTAVAGNLVKAGLSIEQTKGLLNTLGQTTVSPNFKNLEDTVQGIIPVMKQFNLTIDQTKDAISSFNAIASSSNVSVADIFAAVKEAGGTFKAAGGDVKEFAASFATIKQATGDTAESVASAMKIIVANLQRGATVDAFKQLRVELRYTAEEAKALGNVNLTGQFVGPFEAIKRISDSIRSNPSTARGVFAELDIAGGDRQINKVIPLIQNYTEAQKLLNVAQLGNNSLAQQAATAQAGLGNQIDRTKAKFEELFRVITADKGFHALTEGILKLARGLEQVLEFATPLLPVLTAIAGVKLAQGLSGIAAGFTTSTSRVTSPRQGFAGGGFVPDIGKGSNIDSVPAMLMPGEFVLRKSIAQQIGYSKLHALNSGGTARYAQGGEVKSHTAYVYDFDNTLASPQNKDNNLSEADKVRTAGPTPVARHAAERGRQGYDTFILTNRDPGEPGVAGAIKQFTSAVGIQPKNIIMLGGQEQKYSGAHGKPQLATADVNIKKRDTLRELRSRYDNIEFFDDRIENLASAKTIEGVQTNRVVGYEMGGQVYKQYAGGGEADYIRSSLQYINKTQGIDLSKIVSGIKLQPKLEIPGGSRAQQLGFKSGAGIFDPSDQKIEIATEGVQKSDLFLTLAHELGHAVDFSRGKYFNDYATNKLTIQRSLAKEYIPHATRRAITPELSQYFNDPLEAFAELTKDVFGGRSRLIYETPEISQNVKLIHDDFRKFVLPSIRSSQPGQIPVFAAGGDIPAYYQTGGPTLPASANDKKLARLRGQLAIPVFHPTADDHLSDIITSSYSKQLLKEIPQGSKFVGAGSEAIAFRLPNQNVLRIAKETKKFTEERLAIPEVLQAISSKRIGEFTLEEVPYTTRLDKTTLPFSQQMDVLTALQDRTYQKGYYPFDVREPNVGQTETGQFKIIDPGAVGKPSKIIERVTRGESIAQQYEKINKYKPFFEPQQLQKILGYAQGGSTDTVPAMLTPGEFVFNRETVSRIGLGKLRQWNEGRASPDGYASGGNVPGYVTGGNVDPNDYIQNLLAKLQAAFDKFSVNVDTVGRNIVDVGNKAQGVIVTPPPTTQNIPLVSGPLQADQPIFAQARPEVRSILTTPSPTDRTFFAGVQREFPAFENEFTRKTIGVNPEPERFRISPQVREVGNLPQFSQVSAEIGRRNLTRNNLQTFSAAQIIGPDQGPKELARRQQELEEGLTKQLKTQNQTLTNAEAIRQAKEQAVRIEKENLDILTQTVNGQRKILGSLENQVAIETGNVTKANLFQKAGVFLQNRGVVPEGSFANIGNTVNNSIVGRGLTGFGNSLQNKAGIGLAFTLPLLNQIPEHFAGTAEEASTPTGSPTTFTTTRTIGGGITAGATAALALGPLGLGLSGFTLGLSAAVAVLAGFVVAFKNAREELQNARISQSTREITQRANDLGTGAIQFSPARSLALGKDISKLDEQISAKAETNSRGFFGGLNAEKFNTELANQRAQTFGPALPGIVQSLNRAAEQFGKTNPRTNLSDLSAEFAGNNQTQLSLIANAQKIPFDEVAKRFTEVIRGSQNENKSIAALQPLNAQLTAFETLTRSVITAANDLTELSNRTKIFSDTIGGGTFRAIPPNFSANLQTIGAPDNSGFLQSVQAITAPLGTPGNQLGRSARAADVVERFGRQALIQTAQSPQLPTEGLGEKFRAEINRAAGNLGPDLQGAFNTFVRAISANLDKLTQKDFSQFQQAIQSGDVSKAFDQLVKPILTPVQQALKEIAQVFDSEGQRLAGGFAQYADNQNRIDSERVRLAQTQLGSTRLEAELSARSEGVFSPQGISQRIPLESLQKPFQTQQALLNPRGLNIEGIGTRLQDITKEQLTLNTQSVNNPNIRNIEQLSALGNEASRLQGALRALSDAASRAAPIQEKLNSINEERSSRLGLGERVLTAGPDELFRLQRGAQLANIAQINPNIRGLSSEDASSLFDFLRSARNIPLPNGQGTFGDLHRKIIEESVPGIGQLTPGRQGEEAGLLAGLKDVYASAERANLTLISNLENNQNRFITDLRAQVDRLLSGIQQLVQQKQTQEIGQQVGSLQASRQALLNRPDVKALNAAGITTEEELQQLKAPSNVEDLRLIQQGYAQARELQDKQLAVIPKAGELINQTTPFNDKTALEPLLIANGIANPTNTLAAYSARRKFGQTDQERAQALQESIREASTKDFLESLYKGSTTQRIEGIKAGTGGFIPQNAGEAQLDLERKGIRPQIINTAQSPQGESLVNGVTNVRSIAEINNQLRDLDSAIIRSAGNLNGLTQSLLGFADIIKNIVVKPTALQAAVSQNNVQQINKLVGQGLAEVPTFSAGGDTSLVKLSPRGTDTVPALLTPGEFVVNAGATARHRNTLERINNGVFGYAKGGAVEYSDDIVKESAYKSLLLNSNYIPKEQQRQFAEGGTAYDKAIVNDIDREFAFKSLSPVSAYAKEREGKAYGLGGPAGVPTGERGEYSYDIDVESAYKSKGLNSQVAQLAKAGTGYGENASGYGATGGTAYDRAIVHDIDREFAYQSLSPVSAYAKEREGKAYGSGGTAYDRSIIGDIDRETAYSSLGEHSSYQKIRNAQEGGYYAAEGGRTSGLALSSGLQRLPDNVIDNVFSTLYKFYANETGSLNLNLFNRFKVTPESITQALYNINPINSSVPQYVDISKLIKGIEVVKQIAPTPTSQVPVGSFNERTKVIQVAGPRIKSAKRLEEVLGHELGHAIDPGSEIPGSLANKLAEQYKEVIVARPGITDRAKSYLTSSPKESFAELAKDYFTIAESVSGKGDLIDSVQNTFRREILSNLPTFDHPDVSTPDEVFDKLVRSYDKLTSVVKPERDIFGKLKQTAQSVKDYVGQGLKNVFVGTGEAITPELDKEVAKPSLIKDLFGYLKSGAQKIPGGAQTVKDFTTKAATASVKGGLTVGSTIIKDLFTTPVGIGFLAEAGLTTIDKLTGRDTTEADRKLAEAGGYSDEERQKRIAGAGGKVLDPKSYSTKLLDIVQHGPNIPGGGLLALPNIVPIPFVNNILNAPLAFARDQARRTQEVLQGTIPLYTEQEELQYAGAYIAGAQAKANKEGITTPLAGLLIGQNYKSPLREFVGKTAGIAAYLPEVGLTTISEKIKQFTGQDTVEDTAFRAQAEASKDSILISQNKAKLEAAKEQVKAIYNEAIEKGPLTNKDFADIKDRTLKAEFYQHRSVYGEPKGFDVGRDEIRALPEYQAIQKLKSAEHQENLSAIAKYRAEDKIREDATNAKLAERTQYLQLNANKIPAVSDDEITNREETYKKAFEGSINQGDYSFLTKLAVGYAEGGHVPSYSGGGPLIFAKGGSVPEYSYDVDKESAYKTLLINSNYIPKEGRKQFAEGGTAYDKSIIHDIDRETAYASLGPTSSYNKIRAQGYQSGGEIKHPPPTLQYGYDEGSIFPIHIPQKPTGIGKLKYTERDGMLIGVKPIDTIVRDQDFESIIDDLQPEQSLNVYKKYVEDVDKTRIKGLQYVKPDYLGPNYERGGNVIDLNAHGSVSHGGLTSISKRHYAEGGSAVCINDKGQECTAKQVEDKQFHGSILFNKTLPEAQGLCYGGEAKHKALGGDMFVPQGTDTIPAMLTPGEYVINARSASKHRGLLQKINSGYFAEGGDVSLTDKEAYDQYPDSTKALIGKREFDEEGNQIPTRGSYEYLEYLRKRREEGKAPLTPGPGLDIKNRIGYPDADKLSPEQKAENARQSRIANYGYDTQPSDEQKAENARISRNVVYGYDPVKQRQQALAKQQRQKEKELTENPLLTEEDQLRLQSGYTGAAPIQTSSGENGTLVKPEDISPITKINPIIGKAPVLGVAAEGADKEKTRQAIPEFYRQEDLLRRELIRQSITQPGGAASQFIAGQNAGAAFDKKYGTLPEFGPLTPNEEKIARQRELAVASAQIRNAQAGQLTQAQQLTTVAAATAPIADRFSRPEQSLQTAQVYNSLTGAASPQGLSQRAAANNIGLASANIKAVSGSELLGGERAKLFGVAPQENTPYSSPKGNLLPKTKKPLAKPIPPANVSGTFIYPENVRKKAKPNPFGPIPAYSTGGVIPGISSDDNQLISAQPGEYVIDKKTAQSVGYANLANLKNSVKHYEEGGSVGTPQSTNTNTTSGINFGALLPPEAIQSLNSFKESANTIVSGFTTFDNSVAKLAETLTSFKIPDKISMEAIHQMHISLTGAEALESVSKDLSNLVMEKVRDEIQKMLRETAPDSAGMAGISLS